MDGEINFKENEKEKRKKKHLYSVSERDNQNFLGHIIRKMCWENFNLIYQTKRKSDRGKQRATYLTILCKRTRERCLGKMVR